MRGCKEVKKLESRGINYKRTKKKTTPPHPPQPHQQKTPPPKKNPKTQPPPKKEKKKTGKSVLDQQEELVHGLAAKVERSGWCFGGTVAVLGDNLHKERKGKEIVQKKV